METDASRVSPGQAADPLVLAIDVGTSSTRALIYDGQGRSVEGWMAHRPYAVQTTPDGGITVDPDFLVDLTASCIDDLLALVRPGGRNLAVVACDTFWHSLMALDAAGKPLTPVLTWADTRSGSCAVELAATLDEEAVRRRTGVLLHSSYWPAKLRWLSRIDPETFERAACWLSFGEYFYRQLFGACAVSISMASGTGIFDQDSCAWDTELLRALDIREDQLSPLREYSDALSNLRPAFAARWPELAHTPWNLALGDGGCNNVGSGGCAEGWIVVMAGTSGAIRVVRESADTAMPRGLWTYRLDRRRLVQGGSLSAGGNVFAWLSRLLSIDELDDLESQIRDLPPDDHGLTFLPFMAGERSPDWNPHAQAAIVGMTLDTSARQVLQAALEAVSYRFALVFDLLCTAAPQVRGIIGSGAGLIRSPTWMQIMADVLAEPITASAVPEATSRGAALLALEALGTLSDVTDASVPLGPRFVPHPQRREIYRAAIRRQQDLYHRLMH